MRYMLFAILLLIVPCGASALTWDFADGSTHGAGLPKKVLNIALGHTSDPLQSEIIDGVWRIAPVPGTRPTVRLRSPLIGKDSALFDRLTLRLRLRHHSPTEGTILDESGPKPSPGRRLYSDSRKSWLRGAPSSSTLSNRMGRYHHRSTRLWQQI